jgi:cytoskeletal protein CcmA (bactofilin family)
MSLLNVFDHNRSDNTDGKSQFKQDQKINGAGSAPHKLADTIKTFMLIDQEAKVSGKINTSGDVVIEGDFEGEIVARNLTLHPTGRVTGKVTVQTASIDGKLSPEINCSGLLTVKSNGRLHGKMTYSDLIVEQGGKCLGEMLEHETGVVT